MVHVSLCHKKAGAEVMGGGGMQMGYRAMPEEPHMEWVVVENTA